MFLIKSIFFVIVNKKPHFKKVPLLLFQFPSPPTWNNWLSHLLNLYSFVLHMYSSSNLFFCVFWSSSFFFLFFLFFFYFHKATWSRRMAASCPFWWLFRRPFWPYRPILVAVLAEISSIGSCFCWNRAESGQIDQFQPKSAQIEKKGRISTSDAKLRVGMNPVWVRQP